MVYHTIHLPVIDLMDKPSKGSEIISQAFFSEHVLIKKASGDYRLIVTMDGYSGWISMSSFVERQDPYLSQGKVTQKSAHLYRQAESKELLMTLPYGSKLNILERIDNRWLKVQLPCGKEAFIQRGDLSKEPKGLIWFSKQFLGLPYIWGGRSSFGYDCSGFVQMLYKWKGIQLPRDSWQQFQDKRGQVVEINQLETGDLIFWGKSENKIQHVGMYLKEGEFIHTSSRENKLFLRTGKLDDQEWSGRKENHYPFRAARRFF